MNMQPAAMTRLSLVILTMAPAWAAAPPAGAEPVEFRFVPPADLTVTQVSVRGEMNGWGETPMTGREDGSWSVTIELAPGEYAYKYFVDGEWPGDMAGWRGMTPVDAGADGYRDDGYGGQNAVRRVGGAGGGEAAKPEPLFEILPGPPLADDHARLHYHRPDGAYRGWGLHVWEDTWEAVTWEAPLRPRGQDTYGIYWDIGLNDGATKLGTIVHRGDEKDPGPDVFWNLEAQGREVWLISGRPGLETERPDVSGLGHGDLTLRRAHWLTAGLIAWPGLPGTSADLTFRLHHAPDGGLEIRRDGVVGGEAIALTRDRAGLPPELGARFPHLGGATVLRLPLDPARAAEILRGQIAVSAMDADGIVVDATGLQIPGVLDDLFTTDEPLGVVWSGETPTLRLWAPTARRAELIVYPDAAGPGSAGMVHPMTRGEDGVWSFTGSPDWKNRYYLYVVEVYVHETAQVERNPVTDPYSRALSTNSIRSQIVDLRDPALKPDGWDTLVKPPLVAPEEIAIYELHVRDFSAAEWSLEAGLRGTYLAFTRDTPGTRHLAALADAGLTHVHLLPVFDIATINEDRTVWADPGDLGGLPPDSPLPQERIGGIRDRDGYNWGYDPYHYGVPEGSYATRPDGGDRIREFREMVRALAGMGLRVVMDVVYNHTNASGQDRISVLDRIVPGYYHRLNADGHVETSTCCQNTATEHAMMERLMIDDLVHWAVDYKIDGFRFDLMGHHMKRNLEKARDALHALTPEANGVDGRTIYLYGEGWDFGEVQGGRRGVNAVQSNMAGTGIGTFNDRIRDALRGGSPFTDRREQGFVTGRFTDPNGFNGSGSVDRAALIEATDRIRCGLAGNLRDYTFVGRNGHQVRGDQDNNGGYTADPQESINYVAAHDNETLFDKIVYSASWGAGLGARIRMQNLAVSVLALGQGIPFFHAGIDMLRSKSMDADSYDSGDWFNRLDFSYASNNFGVGLPPAWKNLDRWGTIRPLLARPELRAGEREITRAAAHLREMLAIRKGSPLFRLRSADEIRARIRFHNTGPEQIPGLIVMSLTDGHGGAGADAGAGGPALDDLDPDVSRIVVLFNADDEEAVFRTRGGAFPAMALHPVLADGSDQDVKRSTYDAGTGEFRVPGRTTAVFVQRQGGGR